MGRKKKKPIKSAPIVGDGDESPLSDVLEVSDPEGGGVNVPSLEGFDNSGELSAYGDAFPGWWRDSVHGTFCEWDDDVPLLIAKVPKNQRLEGSALTTAKRNYQRMQDAKRRRAEGTLESSQHSQQEVESRRALVISAESSESSPDRPLAPQDRPGRSHSPGSAIPRLAPQDRPGRPHSPGSANPCLASQDRPGRPLASHSPGSMSLLPKFKRQSPKPLQRTVPVPPPLEPGVGFGVKRAHKTTDSDVGPSSVKKGKQAPRASVAVLDAAEALSLMPELPDMKVGVFANFEFY